MGAKAMKTAKSLEAKPRAKPETLKNLNNLQALHISEQVGGTGRHGAAWARALQRAKAPAVRDLYSVSIVRYLVRAVLWGFRSLGFAGCGWLGLTE